MKNGHKEHDWELYEPGRGYSMIASVVQFDQACVELESPYCEGCDPIILSSVEEMDDLISRLTRAREWLAKATSRVS